MTPQEEGFLLLAGFLGDPERKPLTVAGFRELAKKARQMEKPAQQRELTLEDLHSIGCSAEESAKILHLFSQHKQLQWYLQQGRVRGCIPITRIGEDYPDRLRKTLGLEAPASLWYKGDVTLLEKTKIALVGSRDLQEENLHFAQQVGAQCAKQGYVLVSGHARGADQAAEEACLQNGGQVISVVADALMSHKAGENMLFLAEDGFDIAFTPYRALSRNRIIHTLAEKTIVAQCTHQKGGTWDGTVKNLRHSWSPVFCFRDGSPASRELKDMGAQLIDTDTLQDLSKLQALAISLF